MNADQIAFNRFGLGRRPFDEFPSDPRAWLVSQLSRYRPELPGAAGLADAAAIAQDLADTIQQIAGQQIASAAAPARQPDQSMQAGQPSQAMTAEQADPKKAVRAEQRQFARDQHIAQVGLRVRNAVATDTPFVERLVHFWANHFAVSADKLQTIAFSGLLEFDAIRPHVLGKFEDLLLAVERHPAMLLYLDQAQSIGPNSQIGLRAGANRKIGLNENLGREILELHTLGVRSGYSQADVTEFARALTGWTVAGIGRGRIVERLMPNAAPGEAVFVDALHESGERTILGRRYDQAGEAQARAVLSDLARHPATAHHVATKLARHFVADDPSPALVSKLETAYLKSGGDLPTVYRALIDAPEAWKPEPEKFRTPWQWAVALLRGVDVDPAKPLQQQVNDRTLTGLFQELGQPVWRPGSPAGFDDIAASWAAPDALYRRVELAGRVAQQARADADARVLADRLFGADLSAETKRAIAQADSPRQGLALLLVAPEMMRV